MKMEYASVEHARQLLKEATESVVDLRDFLRAMQQSINKVDARLQELDFVPPTWFEAIEVNARNLQSLVEGLRINSSVHSLTTH